jgi:hypothetical protein
MEEKEPVSTPIAGQDLQHEWEKMPGVIAILGELESGAIITEEGIGYLFNRHITSVKRAIQRGELPEPCRLFGQSSWTVGIILQHIEMRLMEAAKEAKSRSRKIGQLSP